MSKTPIRQFKKDTFIYGVGVAFSKGLGLILLTIYTRFFTPVEYGIIEMLTITYIFLSLLMNMGQDSAQSYYFFEQKTEGGKLKQAQLVTAILQWRLFSGLTIILLATWLSPSLNIWLFKGKLDWTIFAAAFSGALFFQITMQSAQVFQLLFRPWHFLGITFFQSVFSATIAVSLIMWLDAGILGYFIGFSFGSLVAGTIGWWLARDYIDWSASNRKLWPRMLKFGLPLVPANLAEYFMETSDRWFLGFYYGEISLGIYAVGLKFAMIISLVVEPFRKAWVPLAMKSLQEPESQGLFSFMARLYMGTGAAAIVVLTAFSPTLVNWVTVPDYYGAHSFMGLLAWKQLFYGFYVFSSLGIIKKEKTRLAALLTGITALLNILLQFILVPELAGMGAALAMLITYFVWNVLLISAGQKLWPVNYPWAILFGQVSLGLFSTGMILIFHKIGAGALEIFLFAILSSSILIGTAAPFHHFKNWFNFLHSEYKLWKN
ncbi:MAG: oligosaccharide flippase family protein [Nitrospinae bacterium]|nr:oligosaccharide flippase family protein [Nitrospinota bacterium]